MEQSIVIVGGGQAAQSLAATLRAEQHTGPITLVCAEPHYPYQRPPLSKKYLTGDFSRDQLSLRPPEWYEELNITLRLGLAVRAIDTSAHQVTLADGSVLAYDQLALTTGAHPRLLDEAMGGTLSGVHAMRTMGDADALAPALVPHHRCVIVGGGYIGLEAAAVARTRGMVVTVIEAADRILKRVAAPATADFFRTLHEGHGVILRENMGLARLVGHQGRLVAAELADGELVPADIAIVGIGIHAGDELARKAGLACDNGIVVDEFCRTSDPDIFAAGDCARLPFRGDMVRIESVQNAIEQAETCARTMLGKNKPYRPVPWFWSDQYDIKLQIAGLNTGYASTITRAGKRPGTQSVWYHGADGGLLAVDAMNDGTSFTIGKRVLEASGTIPRDALADPDVSLKDFMPS